MKECLAETLSRSEVVRDAVEEEAPTALAVTECIIDACSEAKGRDISVLRVSQVFDLADYFVIDSGRSDRQVQGISNRVLESLEKIGVKPNSMEGFEEGQWVLLDIGDVIVHVFYEPLRRHYDIESLWRRAKKLEIVTDEGRLNVNAA